MPLIRVNCSITHDEINLTYLCVTVCVTPTGPCGRRQTHVPVAQSDWKYFYMASRRFLELNPTPIDRFVAYIHWHWPHLSTNESHKITIHASIFQTIFINSSLWQSAVRDGLRSLYFLLDGKRVFIALSEAAYNILAWSKNKYFYSPQKFPSFK